MLGDSTISSRVAPIRRVRSGVLRLGEQTPQAPAHVKGDTGKYRAYTLKNEKTCARVNVGVGAPFKRQAQKTDEEYAEHRAN